MASTDEKCLTTDPGDEQSSPVNGSFGERRRRAREVLSLQRSHLDRLENELTEQLEQMIGEVADSVRLAEAAAGQEDSAAFSALQTQFDALKSQFTALDAESEQLRKQLEEAQIERGQDQQQLRKLEEERDSLVKQLASAEAMAKEPAARGELDSQEMDELQRRLEAAVEEARQLKRTNAELEDKLKARGNSAAPAAAAGGLDWEAQKELLLASLEADDEDSEEAIEQRASIESTVRITDQIVAQKDQELAELKKLLEEQGGAATGARGNSDAEELLDHDEVIRQERERLAQLQAEWREKIGQAEIDVSVERAKLARERTMLDERMRQLEADKRQAVDGESADPSKPTRGRWLARLGLKEPDETPENG